MIALENFKNGFWDEGVGCGRWGVILGLIHRGALVDDGLFIILELTN